MPCSSRVRAGKRVMRWLRGLVWPVVLFSLVAIAAAGTVILARPAHGGRSISAPGAPTPPPGLPSPSSESSQALNTAALHDLQQLRSELTFRPFLPPDLVLPPGHLYNRILWSSSPATAFGMFISANSDPSLGTRALHVDEGVADASNPRDPLVAFASILHPVKLANGTWYEMQQQHQPLHGEWIFMSQQGGVFIQVDGLDPKGVLEGFAASLVAS